jgi:hypothetical protein
MGPKMQADHASHEAFEKKQGKKVPTFKKIQKCLEQQFKLSKVDTNKITVMFANFFFFFYDAFFKDFFFYEHILNF